MFDSLLRFILRLFGFPRDGDEGNGNADRGRPPDLDRRHDHDEAVIEIEAGDGISWGTLSSLSAHQSDPSLLYAVPDQDSPPLRILEIRISSDAARVVRQTVVDTAGLGDLDVEGSAIKPTGGFWLASEGKAGNQPPNQLIEIDVAGRVLRTVSLPPEIGSRVQDHGFEGVAYVPGSAMGGDKLVVAFQAGLDRDPDGQTRIGMFDFDRATWSFYAYPLEQLENGHYCGLSDIMHLGGQRFALIERDGKGKKRSLKWITTVDLGLIAAVPPGATPGLLRKQLAIDLVPLFVDAGRKVEKEIEGLAIAADGQVYAITDNDNERPTLLLRLGRRNELFGS